MALAREAVRGEMTGMPRNRRGSAPSRSVVAWTAVPVASITGATTGTPWGSLHERSMADIRELGRRVGCAGVSHELSIAESSGLDVRAILQRCSTGGGPSIGL